ncbi:MAG: hypothetical protein KAG66_12910 [Methylococcales bacterium]|nr:hypothetical protein [Methylococcales bacterium]
MRSLPDSRFRLLVVIDYITAHGVCFITVVYYLHIPVDTLRLLNNILRATVLQAVEQHSQEDNRTFNKALPERRNIHQESATWPGHRLLLSGMCAVWQHISG